MPNHLPLQRFSIEVNEFIPGLANPGGNSIDKSAVAEPPAPAVVRPSVA